MFLKVYYFFSLPFVLNYSLKIKLLRFLVPLSAPIKNGPQPHEIPLSDFAHAPSLAQPFYNRHYIRG